MANTKKITRAQIEKLAREIRKFLLDRGMWIDTTIYFNGKAFSTDDRNGHYYYNDPSHLVVLEDEDSGSLSTRIQTGQTAWHGRVGPWAKIRALVLSRGEGRAVPQ